jgi:hypothetical protein
LSSKRKSGLKPCGPAVRRLKHPKPAATSGNVRLQQLGHRNDLIHTPGMEVAQAGLPARRGGASAVSRRELAQDRPSAGFTYVYGNPGLFRKPSAPLGRRPAETRQIAAANRPFQKHMFCERLTPGTQRPVAGTDAIQLSTRTLASRGRVIGGWVPFSWTRQNATRLLSPPEIRHYGLSTDGW